MWTWVKRYRPGPQPGSFSGQKNDTAQIELGDKERVAEVENGYDRPPVLSNTTPTGKPVILGVVVGDMDCEGEKD